MYAQSWKPELLLRQSKPASTKVMKPFRATKYFVWPRGGEVRFVQQLPYIPTLATHRLAPRIYTLYIQAHLLKTGAVMLLHFPI
jgi:hypothetical protein